MVFRTILPAWSVVKVIAGTANTPSRSPHLARGAWRALQHFALGHRTAHLSERLLLQLANPHPRQAVLVADLLERSLLVVHEPKTLAENVSFDRLEVSEQA